METEKNARGYADSAFDLVKKGELEKALEEANKAVEVAGNNFEFGYAYFIRALVYRQSGKLDERIADLKMSADYGFDMGMDGLKELSIDYKPTPRGDPPKKKGLFGGLFGKK